MFDNIAPTYDKLNHILSLSIDKIWRRRVVRKVRRMKPEKVMDLATGTGDLAIKMAKAILKVRTEMARIIAAALTKTGNVQTAKAATIETAAVIIAITAAVIVAAICSAKTISSRIPYPTAELV